MSDGESIDLTYAVGLISFSYYREKRDHKQYPDSIVNSLAPSALFNGMLSILDLFR